MENASKALLMAGGVLIAIITIALLVRGFNSISIFQKAKLSEEEQERLVAFNEEYTKYLGQYVYGTEVITVINKSLNNKSHTITTIIKFNEGYTYNTYEYKYVPEEGKRKKVKKENYIASGETLTITNEEDEYVSDAINEPDNESDSLIRRAFKCTKVDYDSYGRVNSITFEEKKWENTYIE